MALPRSKVPVPPRASVIVSLLLALFIGMFALKAQASPLVSLGSMAPASTQSLLSSNGAVLSPSALPSALPSSLSIASQLEPRVEPQLEPLPLDALVDDVVLIDGSDEMTTINQTLKSRFEANFPDVEVTLQANGTDAALDALLNDEIDIAAIGRPLTAEEKAKGLIEVPVSQDAISIIIGRNNTFEGHLTLEQFAKIFRGDITNWADVGGPDEAIRFIDRPLSSDTRLILSQYGVVGELEQAQGENVIRVDSDDTAEVIRLLGRDGISYAIANQLKNQSNIKLVKIAVLLDTLPNESAYPYTQIRGYAYREDNAEAVQPFVGFAKGDGGQAAIAAAKDAEAKAVSQALQPKVVANAPTGTAPLFGRGVPVWLWGVLPLPLLLLFFTRRRSTITEVAPEVVPEVSKSAPLTNGVNPAASAETSTVTGSAEPSTITGAAETPTVTGAAELSTVTGAVEPSTVTGAAETPTVTGAVETPTVTGAVETPTVTGAAETSTVTGAVEPSTVTGAAETPTVTGAAETPTVTGAAETPTVTGAVEPSTVTGAAETPTVTGAAETPTVTGAVEPSTVTGAAETPTVTGAVETPTVTGAVETPTVTGAVETPTVTGAVETSTVTGAVEPSTVTGAAETPTVTGAAETPTVTGAVEPSTVTGAAETPTVTGAAETPTVTGAVEPSTVTGAVEPSTVTGAVEPSTVTGAVEPSTVTGAAEPSTVTGAAEPPTVTGAAEPSTVTGAAEPSTVTGAAEPSTVTGAAEPSTVIGAAEPSTVTGAAELSTVTGAADAVSSAIAPPEEVSTTGSVSAEETVPPALAISAISVPSAQERYEQGQASLSTGQYAQALDSFEQSLAVDPDGILAEIGKGMALLKLGRDQEAIAIFDRAIPWLRDHNIALLSGGGNCCRLPSGSIGVGPTLMLNKAKPPSPTLIRHYS